MNDVKDNKEKNSEDGGEGSKKKEKKRSDLEEYLQSPRKKRKSYVVMAYGPHLNPDLPASIQNFLKIQYSPFNLTYPRGPEELTRSFTKMIKLLIYDDEFCDLDEGLKLLKLLKQKKHKSAVPILFLTARPETLIRKYNEYLLPFHESDDYIAYGKMPMSHVLSRIRDAMSNVNRRRSRRYKVNIPVTFESLTSGKRLPGRMLDLSLHGGLLKLEEDKGLFRELEQIKISLPIGELLRQTHGDFLRLSCKVRRVLISGNHAGVSFEHVTEEQLGALTRFLTNMVNIQVARQARAARSKPAKR